MLSEADLHSSSGSKPGFGVADRISSIALLSELEGQGLDPFTEMRCSYFLFD